MTWNKMVVLGLVLTALVASGGLVRADGNPAVTDLGSNIYLVDGNKAPIPNLLPAEEVQKIAAIQAAPTGKYFAILSPVSPDDQVVLAATTAGTTFTNIHDGSMVGIQPNKAFKLAGTLTNFFWLDANTLGFYALTDEVQILLVHVDRRTGEISGDVSPIGDLGIPVLASSNGRSVLVAAPTPGMTTSRSSSLTVPMPGIGGQSVGIAQIGIPGLFSPPPAGSPAQGVLNFASMFEPFSSDPVVLQVLNEYRDLSVFDSATSQQHFVTTMAPGSLPAQAAFSKDGSKFAITLEQNAVDPDRYRYDGALLSENIYRDVTGNLPPKENPFLQSNRLVALDIPSGGVQVMHAADGDGVIYNGVSWSTDNQTLAAKVQSPGRAAGRRYPQYAPQFRSGSSLRFFDSSMKEVRRVERIEISDIDAQIDFVSPDELIIQSHYLLDRHPFYYNWRSGEFRNIADRAGQFADVVSSNNSRELVFIYTSYTNPPDLYRINWEGKAFARLTWLFEEVHQASHIKQYPVSFTLRNKTSLSGVLIMPEDAAFPPKQMPIVVWQEGGPTNSMRNEWGSSVESPYSLLPNFGFGLLVVPLYGRYGVGPARFNAMADGTNYGQIDIDAMAEIVGQLRTRGWASKVGITGCSYGGYFTTQSVSRHPTSYDAAHTMCSLVDLFSEWSRGYATLAPWFEGLPPANALAEYAKDSPLYNVNRVRTPLLAFHGTDDFLPITVMENFMLQVINNKVPAKMLKFQDTGHGFTAHKFEKEYELYGAQEQLIWFRTYLMKTQ